MLRDEALRKYLEGLAESTAYNNKYVLRDFFGFEGLEPYEAVEWQRKNPLSYRFLDEAYKWLKESGNLVGSMKTKLGVVRGFFVANRVPLPKDKHRFHSVKAPVMGDLSVDEFRKILSKSNFVYRAAFLVMFQSGSGVKELVHINSKLASHV